MVSEYWGNIVYRDSVYYGKITNNTKKYNNQAQCSVDMKNGPGILGLDYGIWIIAKWNMDRIGGSTIYAIYADFGILKIKIKQKEQS